MKSINKTEKKILELFAPILLGKSAPKVFKGRKNALFTLTC